MLQKNNIHFGTYMCIHFGTYMCMHLHTHIFDVIIVCVCGYMCTTVLRWYL